MLKNKINTNILTLLYLVICLFIINISTYAWGTVTLNADGWVDISGSHSFECRVGEPLYPPLDTSATAAVTCQIPGCGTSVNIETVTSPSNSVSIDTSYNLSCKWDGPYDFFISYGGGKWIELPDGRNVCTSDGYLEGPVTIDFPNGVSIDVKVLDANGNELHDRVKEGKKVQVDWNFDYNNDDTGLFRHVSVILGNQGLWSDAVPMSGTHTIDHDFSQEEGFLVLRASGVCSGQHRSVEKLVYIEPEDSCEDNVGHPVNVATGTVTLNESDFSVKGITPINFTRYYNSSEDRQRNFGQYWGHTFDTRANLFPSASNTYVVIENDGSKKYYYDDDGDNIYDPEFPKGEQSRLVKITYDNSIVREFVDGSKEEFYPHYGYLTAVEDKNGNRTTLNWEVNGQKLTNITGPMGRIINFSYTNNKITSITLPDSRIINYAYDPTTGYLGTVTYPDGSQIIHEYIYSSGFGYKLSGIKDGNGNYIEKHTYDSQGRAITSSLDGTNELLTLDYVDDTHTTVTDSLGRVTTYTLDKSGGKSHATDITGPGCQTCGQSDITKTYDANLNVTSITDAIGNVTTMTYDIDGNMLTKTEATGTADERTTTYTYDVYGDVLTSTDNDTNTTTYTYDTAGNLLTETDADNKTTTHTYNATGQILTTTDPLGNTTTFTYDQYGNLETITNELGHTVTNSYDIMGNVISTTDANGNTTVYEYDIRDRLIKETGPDGGEVIYEYDNAGNKSAVTDANGNRTTFTYDAVNRLITTTDPEGNTINKTFDTASNLTSVTIKDSTGTVMTTTTYTYDDRNRLIRTTHADTTYLENGYDLIGNVLTKRDENGNITNYSYDGLSRITTVTDPATGVTSYAYDSRDNLLSVTDANTNNTFYTYDNVNRLISITSPDTGTTTFTYDANGNMLSKTDANSTLITYEYDELNRRISTQFPDAAQDITYTYDDLLRQNNIGRLSTMIDPSGSTSYDYDTRGRISREERQLSDLTYRTSYSYDPNGNLISISYPGGRKITYAYNSFNKIFSVAESRYGISNTIADNITYLPFGDMTSLTYGNGLDTTKTYDNRYRLNGITTGSLKQFSYTRDDVGNITDLIDALNPSKTQSYIYDNMYRITTAAGQWGTITYSYDPVGNRTDETTGAGNTTYAFETNTNKLVSTTGEKTLSFTYDNNGNTTTENTRQYIYNQSQRLIQSVEVSNVVGEYIYNGIGQRVKKYTDNGTKCTVFHYDKDGMLIAESSSSGNIKTEYVYLNGQPLAKLEGNLTYYYHNDHLGSPMMLTDSSGSLVWEGEYLPFGEEYLVNGSITNNLRFPGQYYDAETTLHYNYFRDYNPDIGRYVEADSIGIKKGRNHLFVYALNNPLKYFDETGKAPKQGKGEWKGKGRLCFEKMRTRINSGSCPDWTDCFVCCGDLVPGIYGSASVIICSDVCEKALDKYKKKSPKCCK